MNHIVRIAFAVAVLFCMASFGCMFNTGVAGSGISKTESRQLAAFTHVKIRGAANVTVTVDPQQPQNVSVTTDDNLLPIVQTTVTNGTLIIDNKQSISTHLGVKVVINVASLDGGSIEGSGDIVAKGVASKNFGASVSGSGTIRAEGTADVLDAAISGSGDIEAAKLIAVDAKVAIAGSGNANVNATKTLEASISGSGDVGYSGSPTVTKRIAGSGSVRASGK